MKAFRNRASGLAIAAALGFLPIKAIAADTDNSTKQPTEVGEVVVTANKRVETVQTAATQVTALKGQALTDQGAKSLVDYATNVPGLNISSSGIGNLQSASLRGISPTSGVATVAAYADESPVGSSNGWLGASAEVLNLPPYELDRLEVLSGPQGTLYGAGSLGGVIKYVLKSADPTQYSGELGGEVFTIDHADKTGYSATGFINIPLIKDELAVRISAYDTYTPGFIDNANPAFLFNGHDVNWQRDYGGRLALFWQPTQDLKVKFSWIDQHSTINSPTEEHYNSAAYSFAPDGTFLATPTSPVGAYKDFFTVPAAFSKTLDNLGLNIEYHTPAFDVLSATTWSRQTVSLVDDDTLYYGLYINLGFFGPTTTALKIDETPTLDKFSQEVRFTSPQGQQFEWLLGGFYTYERGSTPESLIGLDSSLDVVPTPPALSQPASASGYPYIFNTAIASIYQEYAIFGDLTYHITPQWDVEGGLRYADNTQRISIASSGNVLFLSGLNNTVVPNQSEGVTTFSVSSRYHFSPDVMVYGRIASGYQPGGPNTPLAGVPQTYASSTLVNYELGLKSEFFDRKVLFDLTGYYIDWTRIQLLAFSGGFDYYANAGHATSKGIELTTAWRPIPDLKLGVTSAYNDATIDKLDSASVSYFTLGYQTPGSPKWTVAGTVDYNFTLGDDWTGAVGGNVKYIDKINESAAENGPLAAPMFVNPSYTTANLYANLHKGPYTLRFYVRNLADSHASIAGTVTETLIGTVFGKSAPGAFYGNTTPLQPRTIGLGVDVAF